MHIVSISLGCRNGSRELEDCINSLTAKGIICVTAAGNDGNYPNIVSYPAK